MNIDPRATYSARQASELLGVTTKTLIVQIRSGNLPAFVLGKKRFSILGEDLIQFREAAKAKAQNG